MVTHPLGTEIYSVKQVAESLGLSTKTIYEAIEQEKYLVALADSLQKGAQPGLMKGLGKENPFKPREN